MTDNELVENVRQAINRAISAPTGTSYDAARAAIAAVREWDREHRSLAHVLAQTPTATNDPFRAAAKAD